MTEKQVSKGTHIVSWAMYYGGMMGGFWILKFMLVPFIFSSGVASLAFVVLTIAVPFVCYYMARQYRDRCCPGGRVGLWQAWAFCVLLYVFAALIAAVGHYIYFAYIDEGRLVDTYLRVIENFSATSPELATSFETYRQAVDMVAALSPIQLTVQLISNNVFYGMWLALPTALIVSLTGRKEEKTN